LSGGGGGSEECKTVRLSFDTATSSCYNWTFAIEGGVGSAFFTYVSCGAMESTTIGLTDNQVAIECVEMSGVDQPTFTGQGYMTQGGSCFEYIETEISYLNCDGSAGSVLLNEFNPEATRCVQVDSLNLPNWIKLEILGNC
jgi:hypothetical protein